MKLSLRSARAEWARYTARDKRLDRDVAIKVLPAQFAQDSDHLARFEREAKAVASLSHPNILAIFDVGAEQGLTFLVTELLEGESLRQRLASSALPWRKAVEIGIGIADGLAAAHAKSVIHRDIKPENVFLTSDERVKILDFGLARIEAATPGGVVETQIYRSSLTGTYATVGTPPYMSPEQLRGKPADARSDLFSLGCVLYEMVAGRRDHEPQRRFAAGIRRIVQQIESYRTCPDNSFLRGLGIRRHHVAMGSGSMTT